MRLFAWFLFQEKMTFAHVFMFVYTNGIKTNYISGSISPIYWISYSGRMKHFSLSNALKDGS
jgi:hypothetical protein